MESGDRTEDVVFWKPSRTLGGTRGCRQVESQEGREAAIGCGNALAVEDLNRSSFSGMMRVKTGLKGGSKEDGRRAWGLTTLLESFSSQQKGGAQ